MRLTDKRFHLRIQNGEGEQPKELRNQVSFKKQSIRASSDWVSYSLKSPKSQYFKINQSLAMKPIQLEDPIILPAINGSNMVSLGRNAPLHTFNLRSRDAKFSSQLPLLTNSQEFKSLPVKPLNFEERKPYYLNMDSKRDFLDSAHTVLLKESNSLNRV
jgi:hypothetical protein